MKSITSFIRLCFISLVFFLPIIFTSANSELFELPKMYFLYLFTIIITTLHLTNWIRGNVPLYKKNFLNIAVLLFLISQIISTAISIDPHTSMFGYYSRLNGGLLSVIALSLLFYILPVYTNKDLKKYLVNLTLFSGLLVSFYAIAQHFGIDKHLWVQDVQSRVFSTFGQPNWLAAYLCILLPLSLSCLVESFKDNHKIKTFYYCLLPILFFISLLYNN